MAYDGNIMQRALVRFGEEKQRRKAEKEAAKEFLYAELPRLKAIEAELRGTMTRLMRLTLSGGENRQQQLYELKEENLALQHERGRLLQERGYPANYLSDEPACPLCNDSGYVNGAVCRCLQQFYNQEQTRELSSMLDLRDQSFDTFSFDWYSPAVEPGKKMSSRQRMEKNYDTCKDYAYQFSRHRSNLLLSGGSGLGKTFLSACIARVVSGSGHSVVYDTAGRIFDRLEAIKFRRDEDDAAARRYEKCDLLIIDDLGTEMLTSFVQSALYQLINGRLLQGKKTVISTNLAPGELRTRYGDAIASRLEGEYTILPFFGEDIRKQKKRK